MTEAIPRRPRWMVVHDTKAARALADHDTRRYLQPFLTRSCSVRDAARELNSDLNPVLMRVRRFQRLGLLRVTHEQRRAGRPVKHYETVAEGFFVPYGGTDFESFEAWFVEEFARREQSLALSVVREALAWGARHGHREVGKRVYAREDGRITADFAFGPDIELNLSQREAPAIAFEFSFTELEHSEAKALQNELLTLARKYRGRTGGQLYSLRLALSPVHRE